MHKRTFALWLWCGESLFAGQLLCFIFQCCCLLYWRVINCTINTLSHLLWCVLTKITITWLLNLVTQIRRAWCTSTNSICWTALILWCCLNITRICLAFEQTHFSWGRTSKNINCLPFRFCRSRSWLMSFLQNFLWLKRWIFTKF